MDVARNQIKYQERKPDLARIKETIRKNYDYWKQNVDRFNKFRSFVFDSSLREEDVTLLMTMSMPQLEFNVLEAYISRLLGEFSKQEPDISVTADDENQADPVTIKVIEQHLRHTLCDSSNEHVRYEVYKDLLSGGFSVLKICTDYANSMSMNQVIKIERVFDPTLCGFDHITKFAHKGDGRFCYELFPMAKDEFIDLHPEIPVQDVNFRRDFAGFNWSYLNDATPTLIIADYYEKKKKKVQICQLRDGRTIKMSQYNRMIKHWGMLQAPPVIVNKRVTEVDQIVRYRLIENRILSYEETDYAHFPLVFVDGNSILLKTPKNGNVRQFTRPYVYHAEGAQRMKNYAGISLANSVENIVQHKFIIKKEALPKEQEWLQAIKDPQKPSNIVVNAFYEENPDQQIPDPIREVQKVPAPPEIVQSFQGADALIQNILGSYDASLGINNNQLSGIAIVEAASQSNAAAMPYIVGFLHGLQRAAQIYLDLLPKYYTTPRTLPIMDEEGKRSFVKINQEGGVNMFYDANALNVIVKAGASFQVQKSRTIMMTKEIMGMSPLFAQFMAEKGLPFILDNMEGKGIEQLKKMVDGWLQELQQQKQMAMQQQQEQMQNNPMMMKVQNDRAKIQLDAEKHQSKLAVDMAKLKQDEMKIMADLQQSHESSMIQTLKSNTERFAKLIDLEIKNRDMAHRHRLDHYDRSKEYSKH
jgi:Phage P22-like portal protein